MNGHGCPFTRAAEKGNCGKNCGKSLMVPPRSTRLRVTVVVIEGCGFESWFYNTNLLNCCAGYRCLVLVTKLLLFVFTVYMYEYL